MQSGFDPPPPPPGGYPPPPPYPPPQYAQQPQAPGPQDQGPQALGPQAQGPQVQGQWAQNQNPYPQNPYGPQQFIPPAPGYVQPYGAYGYSIPTDGKATASLVLGILSIMCFSVLAGIPAIILGVLARKDIARSGGALQGGGLAIGGMILGAFSVLIAGAYVVGMAAVFATASHAAKSLPTAYPTAYPTFVVPTPVPTASSGISGGAVASTTMHGRIKVISLGSGRPLEDQLIDLKASESAEGRTTIVETTAEWCAACKEIAGTIDDPLLQHALADVTLVEVDTDEFGSELGALKMETSAIPFFFKIDSTAKATDAISGDEWDENTPQNEAPVLGAFAKGTLKKRRHPSPVGTKL